MGSVRFPRGRFSLPLGTAGVTPGGVGPPSRSTGPWDLNLPNLPRGGTEGQPGPDFWPGIHPGVFLAGLQDLSCRPSFQYTPGSHSLSLKHAGSIRRRTGLGFSQAREAFPLRATLSSCYAPSPPNFVLPPCPLQSLWLNFITRQYQNLCTVWGYNQVL